MEALRALTQERVLLHRIADQLKSSPLSANDRLETLLAEMKDMQRQLATVQSQKLAGLVPELLKSVSDINSYKVLALEIPNVPSSEALRDLATKLRDELANAASVVAISSVIDEKPAIIVAVSKAAQDKGVKAGDLVRTASQILGGGGGGKADMAQGGGTDSSKISDALRAVTESLN
jgi:alanyl-tRNA synthetase